MYELTILSEFEAAHLIPDYPGKCCRLHGHNWKIEVALAGAELNKLGMVMDFKDLKAEVNKVVDRLDHNYLNELDDFKNNAPTAENIARYIYEELAAKSAFPANIRLEYVKIWESPRSAVKYFK
jgi:6-pyruvoyltetrahydropterin/6-carboxytetrahydropterin synthase